jgi:L-fuconolactonase
MQNATPIIDSQVHAYEANMPHRPWNRVTNWPASTTGDEMVAELDRLGIDGAINVSPFALYGFDAGYAVEIQRRHPGRFALVKPVDPDDPAVEDVIAQWKRTPGTVGVRLMLPRESDRRADDPGLARVLRAARQYDLPVNVLFWGNLDTGTALVDRHPDVRFVLDHLGLEQPRMPPVMQQPWADLPLVLELARRPNVVIKVSGACTLSHTAFPFADIWDPLARVFDAWGIERCLWGTDWTRAFAMVSYDDAVESFRRTTRLTPDERAMLMGGSCARAYGWTPALRAK